MDDRACDEYFKKAFIKHEESCRRCGECCGKSSDPCKNLLVGSDGKYLCRVI